ncbi:MAG: hypothetical protein DI626_00825 [Micavibrio aeruginosavorus]|uniref:Uncharacterized protein n=1 Tax=Micavibrio aeruginosavorus TaxID=349221 RepID=A0A2W5A2R6_9BACT|nr:MAG: hypothetical protein DI626_00825 [Micavibrio aeruginosavorus]
MTPGRLTKAGLVSGIAATAFATTVFSTDSIEGLYRTTDNQHGKAHAMTLEQSVKAPFAASAGCNVRVISYFDNAWLSRMNNTFGDIAKWIKDNELDDVASVVEQVFGENEAFSAHDEMLMTDFGSMLQHLDKYKAGTKAGLSYLEKSPENVVGTGLALIAGSRALKEMLTDDAAKEFGNKFDKELSRVNKALLNTQERLYEDKQNNCHKVPVPSIRPNKTEEQIRPSTPKGPTMLAML